MAATLILTRQDNLIELWRFPFDIQIDGTSVGSIDRDKSIETPVAPGQHTLRLRHGRYSSLPHPFDAADGDTISFRCHGADLWPRFVASLVKPDLAIALKHE
ncbi:MAG: hypothetical protein JO016_18950 [Actinobacteria bacterium]|nr:hypothetical protein [Actinomycetota bacterium]